MTPFEAPARLSRYTPARLAAVVAAGVATLALVAALAALFGGVPLDLRAALAHAGPAGTILWELRLPRIALGAFVGAGLCVTGAALQGVLQNPLADPFVLGVSGGAAAGSTLALVAGELLSARVGALGRGLFGLSPQVACGFLGALAAALLVRSIASRGGRLVGAVALLAGAVLNAVAGALVLIAQLALAPERAQRVLFWLAGSLGYPTPQALAAAATGITLGCLGLFALAGRIRLLSLGPHEAAQLGVDEAATARAALLLCALVVASAVAVSGLIGFVGLVVPHALRRSLGPDARLLLPAAALFGASFLILADALGRLCALPFGLEPPVGALTALVGGPLFLVLLRKSLARDAA